MKFNIWKDCPQKPLPEVLSFIVDNRGKTVPTAEEGHVLIATNCIRNENLYPSYEKIRYLSEETYENWFRAHPIPGDILFVCKGTPGRCCMVPDPIDFCIAQDMVALRVDSNQVYNYFLLAVLRSRVIQSQIANTSVGDVIPHFKKSHFDTLRIPLPPMEIQKEIGDLYIKLCRKQEINKRINNNLVQQAKAIYEEIFLNNPNADMQQGVLSDIATITMGQSPSGSSYNEDGNGEVFYQGRAEFGFRFPNRRLFTTEPKRMAEIGDVLLSVRAPVGDLNVAYERCCIGRGLGAIHSKTGNNSFILYTMLALKPQLDVYNGEGTVFGSINRDSLNSMPIYIPSRDKISQFESVVRPMDDMIRTNCDEIRHLETLRESLLPKLMSGKIDISDIQL